MRELNSTGWMHNRVRMITGSFLVKHLLIDWKEGEKYFKNCLLDYNEANNISGWQWVAGCGADAAPYFRIFNPILQGEKFDKEGDYVKKWLPELKNLPKKFIHRPWEVKDKKILNLGKDYPEPIVIHEHARSKALAAFKKTLKLYITMAMLKFFPEPHGHLSQNFFKFSYSFRVIRSLFCIFRS